MVFAKMIKQLNLWAELIETCFLLDILPLTIFKVADENQKENEDLFSYQFDSLLCQFSLPRNTLCNVELVVFHVSQEVVDLDLPCHRISV